jgi:hypothetical protein
MSNVPLRLAGDKTFQNLVVKHQATFNVGSFAQLDTALADAATGTFGTLTVQDLNQSNSIGNPFAGIVLTPNQLVALDANKKLITYPYSQDTTLETAIQRTATNTVNAFSFEGDASSNQIVFGPGPTTTFNAVGNGFFGGIGAGGTVASVQWLLSGSSSVVNQNSGVFNLMINVSPGVSATDTRILLDSPAGSNDIFSTQFGGGQSWTVTGVDNGDTNQILEFRPDGVTALAQISTNGFAMAQTAVQGNVLPMTTSLYSLGSASNRWGQVFLTSEVQTQSSALTNPLTFSKTSGQGVSATPNLAHNSVAIATYTNPAKISASELLLQLVNMSSYTGGTHEPIPMVQYNNTTGSVIWINASTDGSSTNLTTPLEFGFVLVNANGTGGP